MEILAAAGLVVLGLALLAGGGEALVRAATNLATLAGVTPAVIGLTVVAMGTSLPELVVSILAARAGQPDIALGNVVGSNIFNVTAALGATALVCALPVHGAAVRLEWPFMFLASVLALLLARDGVVDRLEGGFFVVSLALFVAYTVRLARREVSEEERRALAEAARARPFLGHDDEGEDGGRAGAADVPAPDTPSPRALVSLLVLGLGVVLLLFGGRFLVDGAVALARLAGLSERVIGLTVVAAGTGAPELATSVVAALRRRTDLAVANMIGSNIFNVLGILGATALVLPVPVSPAIVRTDMWWMIATALLLLPLLRTGHRVSRAEGGLLVAVYVTYVGLLLRAG